jgi:D-alanyl-D-alanine carboxypeptidase
MFAERRFEFDGRAPRNVNNRNPLLGLGIGADGLKTGHTEEAGFGLVGSALKDGRRVIFAITGLPTAQARAEEAEAIVNWSFRQFSEKTVVRADAPLAEARIWMGEAETVTLVAEQDLRLLVPVLADGRIPAEVVYTGPIEAPVTAGQTLAELIIRPDGLPEHRVPLVARQDVAKGGIVKRVTTVGQVLLDRWIAPETAPDTAQ